MFKQLYILKILFLIIINIKITINNEKIKIIRNISKGS
jgi:hypothetical protein